jgi:Tfp pilus assembly protein PilP
MSVQTKMRRSASRVRESILGVLLAGSAMHCGEDVPPPTPVKIKGKAAEAGEPRKKKEAEPEPVATRPAERASRVLTREDFGIGARDPFQSFQMSEVAAGPVEPELVRQRDVRMPNYDFEELRLVAIVRSGANIRPRALFVGSDGISKPIVQGEYFSRNEVMLATVNSDYIEIEIVDEELAKGLNMTRGERRAIYLKKD